MSEERRKEDDGAYDAVSKNKDMDEANDDDDEPQQQGVEGRRSRLERRFSMDRIKSVQLPTVKSAEAEDAQFEAPRPKMARRLSMDSLLPSRKKEYEEELHFSGVGVTSGAFDTRAMQAITASIDPIESAGRPKISRRHSMTAVDLMHNAAIDLQEKEPVDAPARWSLQQPQQPNAGHDSPKTTSIRRSKDPRVIAKSKKSSHSTFEINPKQQKQQQHRSKKNRKKPSAMDTSDHTAATKTTVSFSEVSFSSYSSEDNEYDNITETKLPKKKKKKLGTPNIPHESLEYPPLYYFLKRSPIFMDCIQSFYRIRWSCTYPLQRRVPFSKTLRKIGLVYTWGELLLVFPFLLILLSGALSSFWKPDVSISGHVSRLPLALAFLTANHNSLLTLFLGIPFERALKFHKLAGRIAFINGVFHTYVAFVYPSGYTPNSNKKSNSKKNNGDKKDYSNEFAQAEQVVKACQPGNMATDQGFQACQNLCSDKLCCFANEGGSAGQSCLNDPSKECFAFAACKNLINSPLYRNLKDEGEDIVTIQDSFTEKSIGLVDNGIGGGGQIDVFNAGTGIGSISTSNNNKDITTTTNDMIEIPEHSFRGDSPNFASFTIDGQINMSGTAILLLIFSMLLTSLPRVRRMVFEVFFYIHVLFAALMVACAFYHSGLFVVILASGLWGGDLFVRKILMAGCRYPHHAKIQNLTDTVVEISFPKTKGFDYNPGQYLYLAIPDVSLFEWHPFSISSSPHQETVTIHVRKRGNWTKALFNLAEKKDKVKILMEGPYGALGVDIFSERYKIMMLLSGGIGVTPMQSICHQLMHEHDTKQRTLKKLWFVWTARDPEVMENMDVTQHGSRRFSTSKSMRKSLSSSTTSRLSPSSSNNMRGNMARQPTTSRLAMKILTQLPNSDTPDEELERELPLDEYESDDDEEEYQDEHDPSEFDIVYRENGIPEESAEEGTLPANTPPSSIRFMNTPSFPNMSLGNIDEGSASKSSSSTKPIKKKVVRERPQLMRDGRATRNPDEEEAEEDEQVLKLDFFLTAKEMPQDGAMMPFITKGRPNLKGIFLQMREEAIRQGERRIAICVCAPTRLVTIARKACAKFSNKQVRFDFHSEVFD